MHMSSLESASMPDRHDCLDRERAAIDVVAQEKIIGVRDLVDIGTDIDMEIGVDMPSVM